MQKRNFLIICGGQSAEHEVSLQSTKNVISAVNTDKYNIVLVGIDKGGKWNRYKPDTFLSNPDNPKEIALNNPGEQVALISENKQGYLVTANKKGEKIKIDIAFPVLHGSYGEDGAIQGLMKMSNISFIGCDILGSAVCMDKEITKQLLQASGIPVARALVYRLKEKEIIDFDTVSKKIGLPLFVKPANLGSSVGITKVKNREEFYKAIEEAFSYDIKIMIEEFVKGREIECAVLGNENPKASVPGEIIPKKDFYSYSAKYVDKEGADLKAPAELDESIVKNVQKLAVKSFKALCCKGMARVDFFLTDKGQLLVNELNTIPGFTQISMYPRLWELSGIFYPELIEQLIELAIEKFNNENKISTDFK